MKNWFIFPFVFIAIANLKAAYAIENAYRVNSSRSQIYFEANSTLHDIKGSVRKISGHVFYDPLTNKTHLPFKMEIPVDQLSTQNRRRDKAMFEMFHASKNPLVRWDAVSLNCQPIDNQDVACKAEGILEINNVKKQIQINSVLRRQDNDLLSEGMFQVFLADFNLKPPSVLGVVRVDGKVKIHFQIVWEISE